MNSALTLPDPQTTAISQISKVVQMAATIRAQCRREQNGKVTLELKRRLDAYHKYLVDKAARAAMAREQRLTEVLIGEFLGPPKVGRPENASVRSISEDEISTARRVEFRRMAAHADQVQALLDRGIVERAAILRQLPANGELSEIDESTKETKAATFNRVNDNIGWARWSWNPVTGCLHNCDYCYARDLAERFYPQGFKPAFLPERLPAPAKTVLPKEADDNPAWRRVFTCSMADLFGKWVPQEWIDAVFSQIKQNPQWEFLCLTKFPERLAELKYPKNVWAGTTVDRQHRVAVAERTFRSVKAGIKWLSCEPLLEPLKFRSLEMFDWVVIGASTGSSQVAPFAPRFEWVSDLYQQARAAGCKVYLKHNLFGALEGRTPGMQPIHEWPR